MAWNVDWDRAQTPDIVGNAIKYRAAGQADQLARQKLTTQNKVAAQYAAGDASGARRSALEGGQIDLASDLDKLTGADHDRALAKVTDIANILAPIAGMPYAARRPELLSRKADLVGHGYTPQAIDTFDPTDKNLQVRIDEALGYKGVLDRADAKRKFDADQAQRAFDNAQPKMLSVVPGGKAVPVYPVDPATGRQMVPPGSAPATSGPTPTPVDGAPSQPIAPPTIAPRSVVNNNPGNLEDGDFARSLPGYVGTDGRFAKFATPEAGTAAQVRLLKSYGGRGLNTVNGIINRWAPPSDSNNTPGYIDFVSKAVGVGPNQPMDMNDHVVLSDIASAIARFEGGPASASNARPAAPQAAAGVAAPAAAPRPGDPPGTIYGDPKPDPGEVNPPAAAGLTALGGSFYQDRLGRIYQPNNSGTLVQTVGIGDTEVRKSVGNVTGLNNVMSAADRYRSAVSRLGPGDFGPLGKYAGDPNKYAEAKAAATDLMMTLKGPEVYNLGVITGPDMSILEGVVADPSKFDTMVRKGQIPAAIGQLEKSVRSKYDSERKSFETLGGKSDALPALYKSPQPEKAAAEKPPQGARMGRNGKFYIQHPNDPRSFPEVKQAPDGNWYIEPTPGKFMKVVG